MSGRHQTYFELREGLARPGCVVCRLAARSARRYLEALSFESVNDHGLRAQLRQARGFCNLHAWQLLDDVRDPFGAGIIYRDVLNHCVGLLAAGKVPGLAPERSCPGCEARGLAAARYVDVLGEHLAEEQFAVALDRAGGLCWRHFALGVARGGRGSRRLGELQIAAIRAARSSGSASAATSGVRPTPGVRAGSAAPRAAPDEVVGDPLVAAAVGLPGVVGLAIGELASRDWGGGPLAGDGGGDTGPSDDECAACGAGRAGVDRAIGRIPTAPDGPLELCAPHAWRAVERVGPAAVRARLASALDHLAERIADAWVDLGRAAPLALGPFELALPAARRARGELAARFEAGRGCAVCAAQLAAEDDALAVEETLLCRPHLLDRHRLPGALTPILSQRAREAWRAIVADLEEYIRKNDYRFRDEPRGPEQQSPWRAVAMVAGGRGLR